MATNLYFALFTLLIFNLAFTFTLSHLVMFKNFEPKNRQHVALCKRDSCAESGRELFKGSKDSASLLVCTKKKFFLVGGADFL